MAATHYFITTSYPTTTRMGVGYEVQEAFRTAYEAKKWWEDEYGTDIWCIRRGKLAPGTIFIQEERRKYPTLKSIELDERLRLYTKGRLTANELLGNS